jgi:hypothetical protein
MTPFVSDCAGSNKAGSDIISMVEYNMMRLLEELDSHEQRSSPVCNSYNASSLDMSALKEDVYETEQRMKNICTELESSNILFNMLSINKYSFPQQTSTEAGNNIYIGDSGTEPIVPESALASLSKFSAMEDKSMQPREISAALKPKNPEKSDIHIGKKKSMTIRTSGRISLTRRQKCRRGLERLTRRVWSFASGSRHEYQSFGEFVPFIRFSIFSASIKLSFFYEWAEISKPVPFPKVGIGG